MNMRRRTVIKAGLGLGAFGDAPLVLVHASGLELGKAAITRQVSASVEQDERCASGLP